MNEQTPRSRAPRPGGGRPEDEAAGALRARVAELQKMLECLGGIAADLDQAVSETTDPLPAITTGPGKAPDPRRLPMSTARCKRVRTGRHVQKAIEEITAALAANGKHWQTQDEARAKRAA